MQTDCEHADGLQICGRTANMRIDCERVIKVSSGCHPER
jgi:hypothetical protein